MYTHWRTCQNLLRGKKIYSKSDNLGSILVGEFRDDEPWKVKEYDKNGDITRMIENGIKK